MGLVQRAIEAVGISTISITTFRRMAERLKLPRVVALRFPMGYPLGNRTVQQRRIILDALHALSTMSVPGTIIDLPDVWEE